MNYTLDDAWEAHNDFKKSFKQNAPTLATVVVLATILTIIKKEMGEVD